MSWGAFCNSRPADGRVQRMDADGDLTVRPGGGIGQSSLVADDVAMRRRLIQRHLCYRLRRRQSMLINSVSLSSDTFADVPTINRHIVRWRRIWNSLPDKVAFSVVSFIFPSATYRLKHLLLAVIFGITNSDISCLYALCGTNCDAYFV